MNSDTHLSMFGASLFGVFALIVSGHRIGLSPGRIDLPIWSRAPVFLNPGAKLWGVYHKPDQIRRDAAVELIVTPIPFEHWRDVWRLEITTEDTPGNLAKIYEIFEESDIEVLFSEGSMHSFAKYHSMTFILSLLRYENASDGDSGDRAGGPLAAVPSLDTLLQTRFLDQLIFEGSGEPRFALKRLNLHWHMNRWVYNKSELISRDAVEMGPNGEFDPGPKFFSYLNTLGPDVEYTPAVDTDFRCIRILFFPANDSGPGYLQFSSPLMTVKTLARIMAIVHEEGGNIIRFQLRRGLPKDATGKFGRLKNDSTAATTAARLDLTIEITRGGEVTRDLLARIEQVVQVDRLLAKHNADITQDLRSPLEMP